MILVITSPSLFMMTICHVEKICVTHSFIWTKNHANILYSLVVAFLVFVFSTVILMIALSLYDSKYTENHERDLYNQNC
jgi:uncharacterized membrane protein